MDILNIDGQVVWRIYADCLEHEKHQMVWDGFSHPGIYDVYLKGMNWEAER